MMCHSKCEQYLTFVEEDQREKQEEKSRSLGDRMMCAYRNEKIGQMRIWQHKAKRR
jgi:hypothetical protein